MAPAAAKGGPAGGTGSWYYFNDSFSGTANRALQYGEPGDVVFSADTDGDGDDSLLIRRGNQFFVRTTLTSGPAETTFTYGDPGDSVLVGDWDGDGEDTLAVRRGNIYYLKNSTSTGVADVVFGYGETTDTVLVGDWDGDGTTTLAVRRALPAAIAGGTAVRVGSDVSPGLYRATGPFSAAPCEYLVTWPGDEDVFYGGDDGEQIYIELAVGQTFTSVPECGAWEYNRTGPLRAVPFEGDSLVGADVAAGVYRTGGADCYVLLLYGFQNDGRVYAELGGGEQVSLTNGMGLFSDSCTWTPVVP